MKAFIRKKVWPLIAPVTDTTAQRVVVMGFPRSGTSVTGRLVSAFGYAFGTATDVRRGDSENPHGYYEHATFIHLTKRFYNEADVLVGSPLQPQDTLFSKGWYKKMQRLYTRSQMRKLIKRLDAHSSRWAVKLFPHLFYAWTEHFTDAKLVCVYRDPRLAVHSYLKKWPNSQTVGNLMDYWKSYNQDMLYHMSTHEAFLVRYEDLFDEHLQTTIVQSLKQFLDVAETPNLKHLIDTSRNRAGMFSHKLTALYPLDTETDAILAKLNEHRSYADHT